MCGIHNFCSNETIPLVDVIQSFKPENRPNLLGHWHRKQGNPLSHSSELEDLAISQHSRQVLLARDAGQGDPKSQNLLAMTVFVFGFDVGCRIYWVTSVRVCRDQHTDTGLRSISGMSDQWQRKFAVSLEMSSQMKYEHLNGNDVHVTYSAFCHFLVWIAHMKFFLSSGNRNWRKPTSWHTKQGTEPKMFPKSTCVSRKNRSNWSRPETDIVALATSSFY